MIYNIDGTVQYDLYESVLLNRVLYDARTIQRTDLELNERQTTEL